MALCSTESHPPMTSMRLVDLRVASGRVEENFENLFGLLDKLSAYRLVTFHFAVHYAYFSFMSRLQELTFLNINLTMSDFNTAFCKFNFWRHRELVGSQIWRVGSGRVGSQKETTRGQLCPK